jgi:hypothetical protein
MNAFVIAGFICLSFLYAMAGVAYVVWRDKR